MVMYPWLPVSFASFTEAIVFSIVYFGWAASEIVGSLILPRLRQRREGVRLERKDKGSGLTVNIGIFASLFIIFAFSRVQIGVLPGGVFYPGIALMIAGVVLRQWAVAVLGRFFSVLVSVQDGQTLVKSGPYRFIRHPSYTGTLLTLTGIGLAVRSWAALLVLWVIFAIVYGYRIRVEEQTLIAHIGDEYVAYTEKTKMLIPFVL
ncbi:MAG TPA: isoprenylcysteine carboxylmethyltransferase family protein [Methanoregula sp.]|nr:isoprenylcysteine carboxylmethyltransferase family protein [Methanoregula sp.]